MVDPGPAAGGDLADAAVDAVGALLAARWRVQVLADVAGSEPLDRAIKDWLAAGRALLAAADQSLADAERSNSGQALAPEPPSPGGCPGAQHEKEKKS